MGVVGFWNHLQQVHYPQCGRCLLFVGAISLFVGCRQTSSSPEVSAAEVCNHQLQRIGLAIRQYRQDTGLLPHSSIGGPRFPKSWRAAIAPYLMHEGLQNFNYSVDEPWSSVHNRRLFQIHLPCKFTCPLESDRVDYGFVSYLMLDRTKAADSTTVQNYAIDLPEDAVLIVESAGCRIEYGEPKDIKFEALFEGESPFGVGKLNSLHPGVVRALRVDGRVIDIPKDITNDSLRKLLMGSASPEEENAP